MAKRKAKGSKRTSSTRSRSHKPRERTAKERAADKARSATVKLRWEEARRYAERHETKPRLDRRTAQIRLTNETTKEEVRSLFARKKRTRKGRTSESKKIPAGAHFRLSMVRPDGKELRSGPLLIGKGASNLDIHRAMKNAVFGVFRKDTNYDEIEEVHVTDDGEFIVDGDEWQIIVEIDDEDEPLENAELIGDDE